MGVNKVIYGNTTLIDISADTITDDKVLLGYTAHDGSGTAITGSCTFNADVSSDTATASEVLSTKTFHAGNGTQKTGSMPNRGEVHGTISDVSVPYTIQQGYHDGSGDVSISSVEAAKLVPENIKEGIEVLGVTGTLAPASGVTATAVNVTPYTTSQTVGVPSGYDYISQVNVGAIYYNESSNATGTTVTIGTVAPAG